MGGEQALDQPRPYSSVERVLLLVVFLVALPGATRWTDWIGNYQHDLTGYYIAAVRLSRGDATIYQEWPGANAPTDIPSPAREANPYNYPPLLAIMLIPMSVLTFDQAQMVWLIANVLMTIAAIALTLDALDTEISRAEWLGIAVAVFLFAPFSRTVRIGQVLCLLLLLSAAAFWACVKNRSRSAAAAVAVGTLIKIYPALFVLAFAVRRHWKKLFWSVAMLALITLSTIWIIGWPAHYSYLFDLLPRLAGEPSATPPNQSFSAFLMRLGLTGTPLAWLSLWLSLILIASTLWRTGRQPDWSIVFGLATVPALAVPTRSWDFNYLLVLVPMLALYFGPVHRSRPNTRVIVLLTYLLISLERYWPLYPEWPLLYSFSLYAALLLWVWLMVQPGEALPAVS